MTLAKELLLQLRWGVWLKRPGLRFYCERLKRNEPFSFSRFGDGEWFAILGKSGANCDGHAYYPELGQDLRTCLSSPQSYLYGLQPFALKKAGAAVRDYIRTNRIRLDWHYSDVFHTCNKDGAFFPMIEQLRAKKVVMVGPAHLRPIEKAVFPWYDFVEVPPSDCYRHTAAIERGMLAAAEKHGPVVFAISASMAAKVMIHHLYPTLGATCWLLDFGAVWDIYAGVQSRSIYRKIDWAPIIRKNLGGVRA
jgi:hypothetical protein